MSALAERIFEAASPAFVEYSVRMNIGDRYVVADKANIDFRPFVWVDFTYEEMQQFVETYDCGMRGMPIGECHEFGFYSYFGGSLRSLGNGQIRAVFRVWYAR